MVRLDRKVTQKCVTKKLNKEINTDGVTLRPKFFDKYHFVNEAVKFPVTLLENAKLTIIQKIFGRYKM